MEPRDDMPPAAAASSSQHTPAADVQRRHNEGHGRRLTAAFEALEAFPGLAESRNRLLRVVRQERVSTGEVVPAVEAVVALVSSVRRLGIRGDGKAGGKCVSLFPAVQIFSPGLMNPLAT